MDDFELNYSDCIHTVNDRVMIYTRGTMCREGVMIPTSGYSVLDSSALGFDYRDPANNLTLQEELHNFSLSGVGELASSIYLREKNVVKCFMYGFAKYLAVQYTCKECRDSGIECLHDNLVGVLLQEAKSL
jgi:hypothetical protein